MSGERALPTAEQLAEWRGLVATCQHENAARRVMWTWQEAVPAIDAEREALWALVDDLAAQVVDWDDAEGRHFRQCRDCLESWEIGQAENHTPSCLTGRAHELRRRCSRE